MRGPKEKKERRIGERLNLKAERCQSPKCAMVRKPYQPGAHGATGRRRALSEFGVQLREKQKVKISYGLDDRNLRQLFVNAKRAKGSSASKLVELLERRLDNVVMKLGFAASRNIARQLVVHGHILVNKKRVWSPGYSIKTGDVISIKSGSESKLFFEKRKEALLKYEPPAWLNLDVEKFEGKVLSLPQEPSLPFEANLLIESFSK